MNAVMKQQMTQNSVSEMCTTPAAITTLHVLYMLTWQHVNGALHPMRGCNTLLASIAVRFQQFLCDRGLTGHWADLRCVLGNDLINAPLNELGLPHFPPDALTSPILAHALERQTMCCQGSFHFLQVWLILFIDSISQLPHECRCKQQARQERRVGACCGSHAQHWQLQQHVHFQHIKKQL